MQFWTLWSMSFCELQDITKRRGFGIYGVWPHCGKAGNTVNTIEMDEGNQAGAIEEITLW
jgi:hypothetical protein